MARYFKILALTSFLLFASAGCGKATGTESAALTSSMTYHYDFNENGCDTGSHTLSSLSDVCTELKNEFDNHYCAVSQRESAFYNYYHCPGTF